MSQQSQPTGSAPSEFGPLGRAVSQDDSYSRQAVRLARIARKMARRASPEAQRLAREGGPEMERLAREARARLEAALPHLRRASQQAGLRTAQFVREHDEEIKRAAGTGARMAAWRVAPPLLRPVITAAAQDLLRKPPPQANPAPPPEAHQAAERPPAGGNEPQIF